MKITIEVPEVFIDGEVSLIMISSENFGYSKSNSKLHGIQSNFLQSDDKKENALLHYCDCIADSVVKMINEELI